MKVPHWTVQITVSGRVVRVVRVAAFTADSAIGKAKYQMRNAVSNAGAFEFSAQEDESDRFRAANRRS